MNFLWDKVTEWLKELLIGSIMSNLTGLFDNVNRQVARATSFEKKKSGRHRGEKMSCTSNKATR